MNPNPFFYAKSFYAKQTPLFSNRYRYRCINSVCLTILLLWVFTSAAFAQSCPLYPSPHLRVGFNFARDGGVKVTDYDTSRLGAGWHHDYGYQTTPAHPGGILYHQMVRGAGRTTPERIQNLLNALRPVVDANPGQVWTVGNEPDRYGQDQLTPAQYAIFYHEVYTFIKQRDPSSRVAVGGIMQPTPIRLRYLDQMLAFYQQRYNRPLQADLWHVHNFLLPENCGWGGGIPPGLDAYVSEALPCPSSLSAHGNLNTFKQQLRNFRQWMKNRGYQNYPLIVSEYGILLSKYHGFPHPVVRDFMLGSFDFMLNTTDSQTGYPADGNRLVQELAWFSLNYDEFDLETYTGLNGNLFDHESRQITPLGLDFENYLKTITIKQIDLAMRTFNADPQQGTVHWPVVLTATFANYGSVAAQDVAVRFWHGDPRAGGQLLGTAPLQPQVLPECTVAEQGTIHWTPAQPGVYTLFAELTAANGTLESNSANNYASLTLTIGNTQITATPTASPTASPTQTQTRTPTVTPTVSPTPSPSPVASVTPNATATASSTPVATPVTTPTPTKTATATATMTRTPDTPVTATATSATATATTPVTTATATATSTVATSTVPATTATTTVATATPTAPATTATATNAAATPTATATASMTPEPEVSATPTAAASTTPTPPTVASTFTPTAEPTATPTATPDNTVTSTPTSTPTPTSTVVVIGNASVRLDIDAPAAAVIAGEHIRYQFRYKNTSAETISQLGLRLLLPEHTTFNAIESAPNWLCSANGPPAECTLAVGDLVSGATGLIDFVLMSEAGLAHSQTVTLTVKVEGNQRVITTANAMVTLIGERGFVQYLPFVQR